MISHYQGFQGIHPDVLHRNKNQEIKSCIRLQIIITQPNTFARTLCIRMQLKDILKKIYETLMFFDDYIYRLFKE